MQVARPITAVVMALALALAPAIAGFASAQARAAMGHAMAPEDGRTADHGTTHGSHMHGVAGADHALMPCCPDEAPVKKAPDDCAKMSACQLCYITVTPAAGPAVASPLRLAATLSWSAAEAIPPPVSSGPFRPPRS